MARFIGIAFLVIFILTSLSQAEHTPEFDKKLEWYKHTYPFMTMKDTVYTFDGEFVLPDGFRYYDSAEIPLYAYWISHFPIWHDTKPVGNWKRSKTYEHDEVSRVVHLPWFGPSFKTEAVPIRIVGEFYNWLGKRKEITILPKTGPSLTYFEWLTSKVAFNSRMEIVLLNTDSVKEDTEVEWYSFLRFCMENTSVESLTENCDPVSTDKLLPGDLIIGLSDKDSSTFVYTIINMIVNKNGEKRYCLATGCDEACDVHIPLLTDDRDNPWLTWDKLQNEILAGAKFGFFRFKNVMYLHKTAN